MADAKIILTAEDRTRAAFASAKAGLTGVSDLATKAGFSLAALGSATTLAGLMTMVKNIANSMDAMNDLKDATGASIGNISALDRVARETGGSFDTVSTSLIKFNQALGTTLKPGSDAEKVIKAIGLNAKDLRDMDPAEALLKTAIALKQFADDGNKARAVQFLFGKSLKEVAPYLNDLAEKGQLVALRTEEQTQAAEKFNKELYKMQSNVTDLGRSIGNPLISKLNEMAGAFRTAERDGGGFFDKMRAGFEKLPGWVRFLPGVGVMAGLSGAFGKSSVKPEGSWGDPVPSAATQTIPLPPEADPKAAAAAAKAAAALNKELEEQVKVLAELSGLTGSFAEDWNRLNVMFAKGTLNLQQLEKAQADLLAKQPAVKKNLDEEKAAREALIKVDKAWYAAQLESQQEAADAYVAESKAREQARLAVDEYVRSIDETHDQLKLEASLMGASQTVRQRALALYRIELELKRQIASIDSSGGLDEAQREEQRARARVAAAQARASAELQIEIDVADKALKEWETTNKQIADSFVDNLMRGGKNIAQYLQDLFRTLVLRPMLQPFGNAMAGMVGSFGSGAAGAAGQGTGILGSIGTSAGGSYIGSAVTSTMGNIGAAYSAGYGGAALVTGEAVSGGYIAGGMASGGIMSGVTAALNAIPVWGWAAMAALAIFGLSKKGGGPKLDGVYGQIGSDLGKADNSLLPTVKPVVEGLQTQYDALNSLLGGAGGIKFGLGISTDPKGTSPTFLDIGASRDGEQIFSNLNRTVGRSEDDLKQALTVGGTDALIGALKASNLERPFAEFFNAVAADASQEAKEAAITVASNVATYSRPLSDLGGVFAQLAELSVDARNGMIEAAGGLQALAQATSTYYENFYSEEEKRAITIGRIGNAFAEVGLSLDGIDLSSTGARQAFRSIVDGLDLTTEAGQKQYTTLMTVSGAFASVTPAAEQAAEAIADIAAPLETLAEAMGRLRNPMRDVEDIARGIIGLEDERGGLQVDLLRAQGDEPAARALQRSLDIAGFSEAEVAIYDYNQGIRDQISVLNTAAAAAQAIATKKLSLDAQLLKLTGTLEEQRTAELLAMDNSLRPMQWYIYALEDEATAKQNLMAAYQQESATLQQTIERHKTYARSLREARDAMYLGEDSPLNAQARTGEALRQYDQVYAAAIGGDLEAIAQLQGAGTAYLAALKESSLTKLDYSLGVARVATGLTLTATAADASASAAQSQLDVMTGQLTALGLLKDVTQQGFAELLAQYRLNVTNTALAAPPATAATPHDSAVTAVNDAVSRITKYGQQFGDNAYYFVPGMNDYASKVDTYQQLAGMMDMSLEDAMLLGTGQSLAYWEEAQRQFDAGMHPTTTSIRGFATGTDYVPRNMLALIHEGERITPKAFNPTIGDNAGVQELTALMRDAQRMYLEMITRLQSIDGRLKKFDNIGMPEVRPAVTA